MPLLRIRRLSNLWIFTVLTFLIFYIDQIQRSLFEYEEEAGQVFGQEVQEMLTDEDGMPVEVSPVYLVTEYMDLLSSDHFSMFNLFFMNIERNSSNFILDGNFL